jgi:hypothetical protein
VHRAWYSATLLVARQIKMQLLGEQVLNGRPFSGPSRRCHPAQRMHHVQQILPRCAAQAAAPAAEKLQPKNMLLVKAVELLFSVKPIFAWASAAVSEHICMSSLTCDDDLRFLSAR